MEANFSATSAWNDWSDVVKLDLWSHPHADELSVKARTQLWGGMSPLISSNQQPTVEARNSSALLETRP